MSSRLGTEEVVKYIGLAYFQAPKYNERNTIIISLTQQHHTINQLIMLAALFKVQRGWLDSLE